MIERERQRDDDRRWYDDSVVFEAAIANENIGYLTPKRYDSGKITIKDNESSIKSANYSIQKKNGKMSVREKKISIAYCFSKKNVERLP